MFEVHCDELIHALAKRAEAICSKLLTRMSEDHLSANKSWVSDFYRNKNFDFCHELATYRTLRVCRRSYKKCSQLLCSERIIEIMFLISLLLFEHIICQKV